MKSVIKNIHILKILKENEILKKEYRAKEMGKVSNSEEVGINTFRNRNYVEMKWKF